jgi:maltose alpha-D-glucosyltransferase/alpha-amylase
LGSVELVEGNQRSALAVVHQFIQNQGDAWTVTSASLDRLIDDHRMLPTESVTETSETASLLQRMRQIGRRTAEMHLAFASREDIPDFAPENITPEDIAHWTSESKIRAQSVFTLLDRLLRDLPETTAHLAQQMLGHRDIVLAEIEAVRNQHISGIKIRHHGDFHLGQVLIAKDDAYILDFEGEPRRSLSERRSKAPPARDVAGFVRSIDYATSAAIDRAPNLTAEERAAFAKLMRDWGERLTAAYWESYREAMNDAPLWPADDQETLRLLDRFVLDKALYEIEYELANRPNWAHIPLDATLRILQQRGAIP